MENNEILRIFLKEIKGNYVIGKTILGIYANENHAFIKCDNELRQIDYNTFDNALTLKGVWEFEKLGIMLEILTHIVKLSVITNNGKTLLEIGKEIN
jgi:hypothetical protein